LELVHAEPQFIDWENGQQPRKRVMSKPTTALTTALRACTPAFSATFVLSLFINLSMLVSPLYSMQIYDRVLTSRNGGTLLVLTMMVMAFLALYGMLEFARSGVLVRTGVRFEDMLRRPLFDAMMRAELSPRNRPGQQVIRDADMIRESLSSGLAATLCDLPWTPVFVALCFFLHPLLGAIALAGAVILFSLALITEYLTKASYAETSKLTNEAHGIAASALRNGEVVRGLGMGDTMQDRWCGVQSQAIASAAIAHEMGASVHAVGKFVRVAVQTALLCAGAWLAIDGSISPGAMMASSIVMGRALAPVEQTVGQWRRILACRSAWKRLQQLFDALPAMAAPTALPTPIGRLSADNVVVWPPLSARPSVKYVSFSLDAGQSLAIVGASGSGKSSLARALAGVWQLRDGTVRLDEAAITQWDQNQLGKHIGYLPQDIDLFNGSIAENIARLGTIDKDALIAAAKQAGAHEAILRLPKGYDTVIGDGGIQLSGGMRQRVGLARALYGDPKLIILDEPNSNLDDEGERALASAMAQMKAAKRTVIVITHRPAVLNSVDLMLVMSFGQAIAFGKRDDVISKMRGNRVAVVDKPIEKARLVAANA
jgi:PrtD family type I secretion system ABC transporter